jgi:hypothetical protein
MEDAVRWILDSLFTAKEVDLQNFKRGFIAGVAVFFILAVMVRILLLYLFRGDKRSNGIKIIGEGGGIIIAPGAVSDLVKGIGNGIKHMEVSKVKLFNSGESLYLNVYVVMEGNDTNFSGVSNSFQKQIIEALKDRFGIECVKNVNVYLDKIVASKGSGF